MLGPGLLTVRWGGARAAVGGLAETTVQEQASARARNELALLKMGQRGNLGEKERQ